MENAILSLIERKDYNEHLSAALKLAWDNINSQPFQNMLQSQSVNEADKAKIMFEKKIRESEKGQEGLVKKSDMNFLLR